MLLTQYVMLTLSCNRREEGEGDLTRPNNLVGIKSKIVAALWIGKPALLTT